MLLDVVFSSAYLSDMDTITDPTPDSITTTTIRTTRAQTSTTLGARLAAASRHAQGLTAVVRDPTVLAELRGLCDAPRTTNHGVGETHKHPEF